VSGDSVGLGKRRDGVEENVDADYLPSQRLLFTGAFVVGLIAVFSMATSPKTGIAGIVSVIAGLLFDLVFSINPALWWRGRKGSSLQL
jgi:hypothetical protein